MVNGDNPQLRFKINIDLDINVGSEFLNIKAGGVDFGKHILELYPELAQDGNKVSEFTKKFYHSNTIDLEEKIIQFKAEWKKSKNKFFDGVGQIFKNYLWPKGEYICYLSIYDCNPRFLENKTFQVYFKHPNGGNHVIAHEMLHFMFFDYLEKNEKNLLKNVDENTIWLLSELFNDKVLGLPIFKDFKSSDNDSYPEVVEFSKKFNLNLSEKITIENFLEQFKASLN